jgi:hypothetical protein
MKLISTAAIALALAAFSAAPAFAAPTVVDFEDVPSFSSIGDFYGASLGVTFGGDALGLSNDALGPYFSNAPSPLGVMTAVGADSAMNFAAGFTSLAFWYSSADATAGAVQVWSGANGTGSLLGAFDLSNNAASGCSDTAYCHFDYAYESFGGLAHSVTFGNATGVAFDNVTINAVPEPATVTLMLAGGLLLVGAQRRRRG